MKKLLYQFDTDAIPSVFDSVVAYDGGADNVTQLGGITPKNCLPLVEGAIYTRAPKHKKNTAIFIGGSDLASGQELFTTVQNLFFSNFRVSVMLDSNGCNTTAAAGVALISNSVDVKGKTAVVLAGTGPVGQRAAVMLAMKGANVRLTSRQLERSEHSCELMDREFGVKLEPMVAADDKSIANALDGAQIVFGAGKSGIQLLRAEQWQNHLSLEVLADVGTGRILGFEGIDMMDNNEERFGKRIFGGIGIGALKLKLHRTCIARLFESNTLVIDAEEASLIAQSLV
jgi:methylenetetrahydrofolate/methylenetetrahydromethanopterin dehydrogenase (NADP+)